MEFSLAGEADSESIAALMNAHNFSVDPDVSKVDTESALGFINGYFEANAALLVKVGELPGIAAAVNLHPDPHRERFQIELFCHPEFTEVEELVDAVIQRAHATNPAWDIWSGANARDLRVVEAWEKFGFSIQRRFSVMRMELAKLEPSAPRDDIAISAIDTNDDSQLRTWHSLHQDAFANHFGFTPRPFEEWIQMVTRDPSFDPGGVLVGYVDGEPVGFCHHTDEFSSDSRGFVIGLGVAQAHQGFGYGEALLNAGAAYSASKGYTSLELAVDTGNESGALKLYDKVGFQVFAAWVQLSR